MASGRTSMGPIAPTMRSSATAARTGPHRSARIWVWRKTRPSPAMASANRAKVSCTAMRPVGDRADRAARAGARTGGEVLLLDASAARGSGLGAERTHDPRVDRAVHDGEFRGQLGGFIHDAVAVPVGEDLDGAASTPGQRGDEGVFGLVHHVFAEDRLVLLAAPPPVLVVGQEVPGDGRSQDVFEDVEGQGVGMDGAESRHDRRGQYGPEPVPAEEHERHPNGRQDRAQAPT